MTPSAPSAARPGLSVGSTSEFSLFFRGKPGRVLDHPQAAEILEHPAVQPLLDEAAD